MAGDRFTDGYAVGQREGVALALHAHAEALRVTSQRLAKLPDTVAALNEAAAILTDASEALTDAPLPDAGEPVDRGANGAA